MSPTEPHGAPAPADPAGCRATGGGATALGGEHVVVLVDAPITDPIVGRLAGTVLGGRPLDDLVAALEALTDEAAPLPDLVAAERRAGHRTVLLRGRGRAERPDGSRIADGGGRRLWRETTLGDAGPLVLLVGDGPTPGSPSVELGVGISPAGALHLAGTPAGASAQPAAPGPAEPGAGPLGRPVLDEHHLFHDTDPIELDEQHLFDGTVIRSTAEVLDAVALPPDPMDPSTAQFLDDDPIASADPTPQPPAAPTPAPQPQPPKRWTAPTGAATAAGGAAAPTAPDPDASPPAGGLIDSVPGFSTAEPATPPVAPTPAPVPEGGSRLTRGRLLGRRGERNPQRWAPPPDHEPTPPPAMPAAVPTPHAAEPTPPPDAPTAAVPQVDALDPATTALRPPRDEPTPPPATDLGPDDDGLDAVTVAREVVRARALAEPTDSAGDGLAVTAVLCDRSHANPPHYDRCRVCDLEIVDRSMFIIHRPSLGTLRFSSGHDEPLDENLVIGRSPAPGLLVNDRPTRAVVLPSPDGSLSRTHAVVQIEGWQVQVIDRDSTNNTFVTVPGQPEFQLRPGEAFPIPPGTVVRLGDEVEFRFDPRP